MVIWAVMPLIYSSLTKKKGKYAEKGTIVILKVGIKWQHLRIEAYK